MTFGDQPAHAAYRLHTHGGPLERVDAMMAHRLHQLLIAASYDVIGRRIARAWNVDYRALFA